jgi:hypothetical protein
MLQAIGFRLQASVFRKRISSSRKPPFDRLRMAKAQGRGGSEEI